MSNEGYISGGSSLVENVSTQTGPIKMEHGMHTTIDADDTVVTKLGTIIAVVATLESVPVLTCDRVLGIVGDQAGSPAAGSFQVKSFRPTDSTLTTPIAATAFSKKVAWVAFGY